MELTRQITDSIQQQTKLTIYEDKINAVLNTQEATLEMLIKAGTW